MKTKLLMLAACLFLISAGANAKMVARWDPAAYAQGKFAVEKTAYVQKEEPKPAIQIESKHILVKVDYTGKIFARDSMFAMK